MTIMATMPICGKHLLGGRSYGFCFDLLQEKNVNESHFSFNILQ